MQRINSIETLNQVSKIAKTKIDACKCRILICAGTGCLAGGSGEIYERMCQLAKDDPDVQIDFKPEIACAELPGHGLKLRPQPLPIRSQTPSGRLPKTV